VIFTFVDNPDYETTNNIYSMALAFDEIDIDQDIMLIESDLIYNAKIIKQLLDNPNDNVALVDKYGAGMDGTVVKVSKGAITQVIPPHLQSADFDFSDKFKTLNIYKFSKEFASNEFKKLLTYYAKVIDDNCYYELILGILIYMQQQKIYALEISGDNWAEVDDPNDLNSALFVFEDHKKLDLLNDAFGGYWQYDIIDFCFIRNMYFPNGSVLSELKNNMNELLWNYGSKQKFLDQKLAYYLLCDVKNVVCLNGAAQVYPILRNYLKGKKGTIPHPTFGEYYRLFDSHSTYKEEGDEVLNINDIVYQSNDVVVIVNPNNPTGTEFESMDILRAAKEFPNKLFVIDESFIEFSETSSLIPYLEETPQENIIIIKSLSKSLGLPGIRLGYVYSNNKEFLDYLHLNVPIWNMNSMAENFLEIILKHRTSIENSFKRTIEDRKVFSRHLENLRAVDSVLKSGANFITCKMTINTEALLELQNWLLREHKIYIKDASNKFNDDIAYIRLAVRTNAENLKLVDLIDSYK
jgi:histidinol-phosphate/aromatic aminotransferase/cobyric acid decarboxylase-like protein/choline kinase